VGTGRGAQSGILVRDAGALERAKRIQTLVVDKTGTLTMGRPVVTDLVAANAVDPREMLTLAAGLERGSEHPLAGAVLRKAIELGVTPATASRVRARPGQGIEGEFAGRTLLLGTPAWITTRGLTVDARVVDQLAADGKTVLALADEARTLGYLGVTDPLRQSTAEAVSRLHAAGVELVLLTGDNASTAQTVARQLGIASWKANVLPEDKAAEVLRLKAEGKFVGMAGDGINDAPALASADVGIAMGGGTDVAIESAGVTLLTGDLLGIVRARRLSVATMRNIRQNLVFAFLYNSAGVPIAAGVLYPVFGILLSPMVGAAAMALSSVSVIANALRLARSRLD